MRRLKVLAWNILAVCIGGMPFATLAFWLFNATPKFREIYQSLGGELPRLTIIVLKASDLTHKYWLLSLGITVVAWLVTVRFLLNEPSRRRRMFAWCMCGIAVALLVAVFIFALFPPLFPITILYP